MRTLAVTLVLALATSGGAAAASAAEGSRAAESARKAPKPKVKPRTVTLDVKDAEARDVLKSMQKQCGIKNLIIDPGVNPGGGTFYFRDVPCDTAFRIVLRTYGLTSQVQVLR